MVLTILPHKANLILYMSGYQEQAAPKQHQMDWVDNTFVEPIYAGYLTLLITIPGSS